MTPEELGAHLVDALGAGEATVSGGGPFRRATVDVAPDAWAAGVRAARDDADLACNFLDWLSAVDEQAEGFAVVAHLWSTTHRHGLLLRTVVPRDEPVLV